MPGVGPRNLGLAHCSLGVGRLQLRVLAWPLTGRTALDNFQKPRGLLCSGICGPRAFPRSRGSWKCPEAAPAFTQCLEVVTEAARCCGLAPFALHWAYQHEEGMKATPLSGSGYLAPGPTVPPQSLAGGKQPHLPFSGPSLSVLPGCCFWYSRERAEAAGAAPTPSHGAKPLGISGHSDMASVPRRLPGLWGWGLMPGFLGLTAHGWWRQGWG